MMLDGTSVSAAFDNTMDMGIVGTTAATLWYINWSDNSSIRLVSGHKTKVLLYTKAYPVSVMAHWIIISPVLMSLSHTPSCGLLQMLPVITCLEKKIIVKCEQNKKIYQCLTRKPPYFK